MTDNEIIKALECCTEGTSEACRECVLALMPYPVCKTMVASRSLDLINRQKAEVERLEIALKAMRGSANSYKAEVERLENSLAISKKETKRYKALCQTIQSETVKGVAFMLRAMGAGRLAWDEYDEEIYGFLTVDEIDNLLKEFMEGKPDGEPMQT